MHMHTVHSKLAGRACWRLTSQLTCLRIQLNNLAQQPRSKPKNGINTRHNSTQLHGAQRLRLTSQLTRPGAKLVATIALRVRLAAGAPHVQLQQQKTMRRAASASTFIDIQAMTCSAAGAGWLLKMVSNF
jgi:hypothetical protein